MAGVNKVIIIGNLGRDPEIRYTQSGAAICNFSVATSESWIDKNSGQKQERTEWHRIVIFGKQAENAAKYLAKGSQVYVEGKLRTNTYEKDGQTHYATDINAQAIQYLSRKTEDNAGSAPAPAGNPANATPPPTPPNTGYSGPEDDVPF